MTTNPPVLDATAAQLDLAWTQGDPLAFKFILDESVAGDYRSQVRQSDAHAGVLLLEFEATAVELDEAAVAAYAAQDPPVVCAVGDTEFTLTATAAQSAAVTAGSWFWDLQEVDGVTRLAGRARVKPGVTVIP